MSVWNDILLQADNIRNVLLSHRRDGKRYFETAANMAKPCHQIVFCGVGSGLNATIPAVYYLMAHGISANYLDATELIYDLINGFSGSLLVLNTRSGETAELIRAAELANEAGIPTIAVTNEPDSRVGRLARLCIPTHSRWDELVVISAYGGMLASELLFAATIVDRLTEMFTDLERIPDLIDKTFEQTISERDKLCNLFRATRPIYLLGRGSSIAAVNGGALVIEETCRRPVVGMAAGLFRQGPIEVVDEKFQAIVFEGSGKPAKLNYRLAMDLINNGAGIAWIGSRDLPLSKQLKLPELPGHLLAFLEIIPCQVLAHDLARLEGFTPGTVRYIQRVITSEAGIPSES